MRGWKSGICKVNYSQVKLKLARLSVLPVKTDSSQSPWLMCNLVHYSVVVDS